MLIDSNVLVEIGRSRAHRVACRDLMTAVKQEMIEEGVYITRFALSAVEALLVSADRELVKEILILIHLGMIKVVENKEGDELAVIGILKDLDLDFDDATQFLAANSLGTYLVTYDQDFAKTSLKTKTPEEVLSELANS